MYQELSDELQALQRCIDQLYENRKHVERLDLIVLCEVRDLHRELMEIVHLLPPGSYTKPRLLDELNSYLSARALSQRFGLLQ